MQVLNLKIAICLKMVLLQGRSLHRRPRTSTAPTPAAKALPLQWRTDGAGSAWANFPTTPEPGPQAQAAIPQPLDAGNGQLPTVASVFRPVTASHGLYPPIPLSVSSPTAAFVVPPPPAATPPRHAAGASCGGSSAIGFLWAAAVAADGQPQPATATPTACGAAGPGGGADAAAADPFGADWAGRRAWEAAASRAADAWVAWGPSSPSG
jgi:hypothetical protein